MQADYPQAFRREQGCTEAEWLGWLPGAVGGAAWRRTPTGAEVALPDGGLLSLRWQVLSPRRIALITLPRLQVDYAFDADVTAEARRAFMRYFDLYLQRGGG